jgi:hypothetical protein
MCKLGKVTKLVGATKVDLTLKPPRAAHKMAAKARAKLGIEPAAAAPARFETS